MSNGFVLGLDLGQRQDYTAAALLERRQGEKRGEPHWYACRWLKRWPLSTRYPVIVAEVKELVTRPPLVRPLLAVDQTGVGAAVVDMFAAAEIKAELQPVLITGGHETTLVDGCWHVPKKELVSVLQVLLQSKRLQIAAKLEHAEALQKELQTFKVKITVDANETFEAWRERDHDDLVLAVALAAWLAEHEPPKASAPVSLGGGCAGAYGSGIPGVAPRTRRGEASPDPLRDAAEKQRETRMRQMQKGQRP
jgi:hypothetical protein